jgi:hypothetical protein
MAITPELSDRTAVGQLEPMADPPQDTSPRPPGRHLATGRARRRWLRRIVRTALAGVVALTVLLGISVAGAVRRPGNESLQAKWADWLRDHHGEALVIALENWYYEHQQSASGGQPAALNPVPVTQPVVPPTTASAPTTALPRHLAAPADVPLIVEPGLPDEGHWQPAGPTVAGIPSMYVVQFRADETFTSEITTAVWCDPTLLRLRLVPGSTEPGGSWSAPPVIEGAALQSIVAAFNGGFRSKDAQGGFYSEGIEAVPLRDGAASVVIDQAGHVQIGAWGRDVSMTSEIEAVLQNLTLIVDGGEVDPAINRNDTSAWGATLDGQIAVARSGVGVTADGAMVYVAGPALSARSLADSLRRAGAVRALTLDINPTWVTFNFYDHPDPVDPASVTGYKLYPEMERPAERYLTPESRDFFTISLY